MSEEQIILKLELNLVSLKAVKHNTPRSRKQTFFLSFQVFNSGSVKYILMPF